MDGATMKRMDGLAKQSDLHELFSVANAIAEDMINYGFEASDVTAYLVEKMKHPVKMAEAK